MEEGEEKGDVRETPVNSYGRLKPVLDSIFAEVQANIPVLELDGFSDDEVDEHVPVFSREELPSIESSSEDEEEASKEVAAENIQVTGDERSDERWASNKSQGSEDLLSTPMAANTVQLDFRGLSNLDLEELLVQFNLEPSCDFESLMADGYDDNNNTSDQISQSIALMEELTILTQKQLADSAPLPKLLPSILDNKNLETDHNLTGEESIACDADVLTSDHDSSRTDCLPHTVKNCFEMTSCGTSTDKSHLLQNTNQDAHCDTSDMPFRVSRGVSAASCGVNNDNSWNDIATDENRATTVFLDLRTETSQDSEQSSAISSLLQRLSNPRNTSNGDSSDESSSDDEFDLAAARRSIKESCLQLKQKRLNMEDCRGTEQRKAINNGAVKTINQKKTASHNHSVQSSRQQENTVHKQNGHLRMALAETARKTEKEKSHVIPDLFKSENEKRKEVTENNFYQTESLDTMINRQDLVTVVDLEERSDSKVSRNKRELMVNRQDLVTVVDLEERSDSKMSSNKRELKEHKLQQEQERARRQRLQKSLENLRPTTSSGGRYSASTNTPVAFDLEASYEEPPASLPEVIAERSYLLLSAKLSACGEVASVRSVSKAVPNADTHIYASLLAWLLSVVSSPDPDNTLDYAHICGAPFHVIGLQQTWRDGQLVIDIAIINRKEVQTNTQATARGKTISGTGNFKAAVTKFLTTNSLQSLFTRMVRCGTKTPSNHCFNQITFSQRNLSTYLNVNPDPKAFTSVFGTEVSFFWQTAELEETLDLPPPIPPVGSMVDNTVMLMQHAAYRDPFCILDVLWRVWRVGLDVSGVRLLYTNSTHANDKIPGLVHPQVLFSPQKTNSSTLVAKSNSPVVAIAIRGANALSIWLDEVGPQDPYIACRTDPNSLRALYSKRQISKEDHMFYCPRNSDRASTELARWFGGRVPGSGMVNIGSSNSVPPESCAIKTSPGTRKLPTSTLRSKIPRPPSMLVSTTDTQMFLLISPVVPVRVIGAILNTCCTRGFSIQGIRRVRLNYKRMNGIGFSQAQLAVFCPRSSPCGSPGQSPPYTSESPTSKRLFNFESDSWRSAPAVATTVLWLHRENACHHAASLVEVATLELKACGFLPGHICDKDQLLATHLCFLPVPYSEAVLKHIGGDFSHVPDSAIYSTALFRHTFYSNAELEQVCVVTLLRDKALKYSGDILNHLLLEKPLGGSPASDAGLYCGFELLGLKLLPHLSTHQAKEFTPFEVGTTSWQESLQTLTSGPAFVCALRGVNAFARLQDFIHSYSCVRTKGYSVGSRNKCPDIVMSTTAELAYRQLSVMFHERELYSDQSARKYLKYLPPQRRTLPSRDSSSNESLSGSESCAAWRTKKKKPYNMQQRGVMDEGACGMTTYEDVPLLQSLLNGPRPITTVATLKPEATGKHLGRILRRFAQEGFSVVGMRLDYLDKETAVILCQGEEPANEGQDIVEKSVHHMMSGPVLITCLQRENSVKHLLDILGPHDPRAARQESQFLLRGCFGVDEIQNGLYGSSSYDTAVRDQRLLFPGGLCCPATVDLKAEGMPCLAVDDIFDSVSQRRLVKSTYSAPTNENTHHPLSILPSSLLEINCVLLLPPLVKIDSTQGRHRSGAFAEVIDGLISQAGFRIIGLRMVLFSRQQAEHCVGLYRVSLDSQPDVMANEITKRPSIVLALLRDNAVTCFDMLLGSSGKRNSLSAKYRMHILAARTTKQAERLLECFFDKLILNPKAEIVNAPSPQC